MNTKRVKDLTGKVFGRITVLKQDGWYYPPKGGGRKANWLCECSCGNKTIVKGSSLTGGTTTSCGCYQRDIAAQQTHLGNSLPEGEAALNSLFNVYKQNAKARGYSFLLTKEAFQQLTKQDCFYCGSPPSSVHKGGTASNGGYTYTGIDRVDNTKGYEEVNVVPCCTVCNRAKMAHTQEEFFDRVKKIYEKHLRSE